MIKKRGVLLPRKQIKVSLGNLFNQGSHHVGVCRARSPQPSGCELVLKKVFFFFEQRWKLASRWTSRNSEKLQGILKILTLRNQETISVCFGEELLITQWPLQSQPSAQRAWPADHHLPINKSWRGTEFPFLSLPNEIMHRSEKASAIWRDRE